MKCRVQKKLKLKLRSWSKIEAKIILDILMNIAGMYLSLAFFEYLKYVNIYRLPLGRVQKD